MSTTTPTTPEEWVTRSDAAVLIGRSVDTVKRLEKKLGLDTNTDPSTGAVLLRVADLTAHGLYSPATQEPGLSGADTAELRRALEQLDTLRASEARLTGQMSEIHSVTTLLREQITEKDKQLRSRDQQIDRLTSTLASLVTTSRQEATR